jgi:hypothetical protein
MNSIPSKTLSVIAHDVALELGLPWRVGELREKATEACETAEPPSESLGLSRKQVNVRVLQGIKDQVSNTGREMDALPPDQSEPTPEQIEMALDTFSIDQWTNLMAYLDQTGTRTLLTHIRQDDGTLIQRLKESNPERNVERDLERIEVRAIMRDTDL